MAADVTLLAALIAGSSAFSSPCVLPLVPPYLVYLAGTSLERLAGRRSADRLDARHAACGAAVRRRLHHRVRGAGRERERHRRRGAGLVRRARDRRGHRHHRHGAALPRRVPDRLAACARSAWSGEAGRAVGRLCDGARLRVRLDAVHRADPGGDPGGRGVRADGGQGRRAACGLFARARHSVPAGRRSRSEPFAAFLARFRRHLVMSSA